MDNFKKIALWATGIIAILIVLASILLAFNLISIDDPGIPALSTVNTTSDQEVNAKRINNYKELVSSLQAQRTNLYDFVILKTLLPLFNSLIATVLTYIFAKTALQAFTTYMAQRYKGH